MAGAPDGDQFHFDPATYLDMIREEVPAYEDFQDAVAAATKGIGVERVWTVGSVRVRRPAASSTSIRRRR